MLVLVHARRLDRSPSLAAEAFRDSCWWDKLFWSSTAAACGAGAASGFRDSCMFDDGRFTIFLCGAHMACSVPIEVHKQNIYMQTSVCLVQFFFINLFLF